MPATKKTKATKKAKPTSTRKPQVKEKRLTALQYLRLLEKTSLNGGFPANEGDACTYRTKDGKKCAVGLIMPDKYWIPGRNTSCIKDIHDECSLDKWIPKGIDLDDLADIQFTHDDLTNLFDRTKKEWDHSLFMKRLMRLDCFKPFKDKFLAKLGV